MLCVASEGLRCGNERGKVVETEASARTRKDAHARTQLSLECVCVCVFPCPHVPMYGTRLGKRFCPATVHIFVTPLKVLEAHMRSKIGDEILVYMKKLFATEVCKEIQKNQKIFSATISNTGASKKSAPESGSAI